MKNLLVILFTFFIAFGCAEKKDKSMDESMEDKSPSIVEQEVTYSSQGTTLKGFLAYDENMKGERPGVIVVHEWWGQNEYPRERARMLAGLGYVALAVDMYGNGKTTQHPDDAGKFARETMQKMDTAKARFNAGLNLLKEQPQTDSNKIAAIGYCFGGGIVLRMALAGADLDAVASFHGDLPTEQIKNPDQVKAKIIVFNGADDPFAPQDQVDGFKQVMHNANIDYEFINYPGAKHSFTNPSADSIGKKYDLPLVYNKEADEKSWQEMQDFFNDIFK